MPPLNQYYQGLRLLTLFIGKPAAVKTLKSERRTEARIELYVFLDSYTTPWYTKQEKERFPKYYLDGGLNEKRSHEIPIYANVEVH